MCTAAATKLSVCTTHSQDTLATSRMTTPSSAVTNEVRDFRQGMPLDSKVSGDVNTLLKVCSAAKKKGVLHLKDAAELDEDSRMATAARVGDNGDVGCMADLEDCPVSSGSAKDRRDRLNLALSRGYKPQGSGGSQLAHLTENQKAKRRAHLREARKAYTETFVGETLPKDMLPLKALPAQNSRKLHARVVPPPPKPPPPTPKASQPCMSASSASMYAYRPY